MTNDNYFSEKQSQAARAKTRAGLCQCSAWQIVMHIKWKSADIDTSSRITRRGA